MHRTKRAACVWDPPPRRLSTTLRLFRGCNASWWLDADRCALLEEAAEGSDGGAFCEHAVFLTRTQKAIFRTEDTWSWVGDVDSKCGVAPGDCDADWWPRETRCAALQAATQTGDGAAFCALVFEMVDAQRERFWTAKIERACGPPPSTCNATWWASESLCGTYETALRSNDQATICSVVQEVALDDVRSTLLARWPRCDASCGRLSVDCASLDAWEACDSQALRAPYAEAMSACLLARGAVGQPCVSYDGGLLHVGDATWAPRDWDPTTCDELPLGTCSLVQGTRCVDGWCRPVLDDLCDVEERTPYSGVAGCTASLTAHGSQTTCTAGASTAFGRAVDALKRWQRTGFLPDQVAYANYKRTTLELLESSPSDHRSWVACANASLRADDAAHACDALRPTVETCYDDAYRVVSVDDDGMRVVEEGGRLGGATWKVREVWWPTGVAGYVGLPHPICRRELRTPCTRLVLPTAQTDDGTEVRSSVHYVGGGVRRDVWQGTRVVNETWSRTPRRALGLTDMWEGLQLALTPKDVHEAFQALSDDDVQRRGASWQEGRVSTLDLRYNEIGDEGALALAAVVDTPWASSRSCPRRSRRCRCW